MPNLLGIFASDIHATFSRAKRNFALLALIGLFLITAYVAGLIALGTHLAALYGPTMSALIVAASMVTVAIVFGLILLLLKQRDKKRKAKQLNASKLASAAALSILPHMASKKGLVAMAALGGLAYLLSLPGDDE